MKWVDRRADSFLVFVYIKKNVGERERERPLVAHARNKATRVGNSKGDSKLLAKPTAYDESCFFFFFFFFFCLLYLNKQFAKKKFHYLTSQRSILTAERISNSLKAYTEHSFSICALKLISRLYVRVMDGEPL